MGRVRGVALCPLFDLLTRAGGQTGLEVQTGSALAESAATQYGPRDGKASRFDGGCADLFG